MAKERGAFKAPWAYVFDDDLKADLRAQVNPVAKSPLQDPQIDALEYITTNYVAAMDRAALAAHASLRKKAVTLSKRAHAFRETFEDDSIRHILIWELGRDGADALIDMLHKVENLDRWKAYLPGAVPEEESRPGRERLAQAQYQADLNSWWKDTTNRRATSSIQNNAFMNFMELVNSGLRLEYRLTVSRDAIDRRNSQAELPEARRQRLIAGHNSRIKRTVGEL